MGGNYDTYVEGNSANPDTPNDISDGGVFRDVFQNPQQRIPTLSGVAQNIAPNEGEKHDKKQYAA